MNKLVLFICFFLILFSPVCSQQRSVNTTCGCYALPPQNINCAPLSNNSILVTWDSMPFSLYCQIINYEVYVDDLLYSQNLLSTANKQVLTGLEKDKLYNIKVRTVVEFSTYSIFSEIVSFRIADHLISKTLLSENFDNFSTGSPGPGVSSLDISLLIDSYTQTEGWSGYKVYHAGGVAKMGTSGSLGYIITPEISLSGNTGNFSLQFDAMAWSGDSKKLKIYLNDTLVYTITDLNNDATYTLKSYKIELSGGTTNSKIRFEGDQASKGRFFLDNLKIFQGELNFPNLHVTNLSCSDSISGKQTTIKWTVRNDGKSSTSNAEWHDKIWLINDITQNFSNAVLLCDKLNKDSLISKAEYNDSVIITLPERISGEYFLVATSDIKTISSIDWTPVANSIPLPYLPNINNSPYPFLFANTGTYFNEVYEDGEANNMSDNFFYKLINITLPPLADLQVTRVDVPETMIAERKATISATITNKGNVDVASNKSFVNRLYWSMDAKFNKNMAGLLASQTLTGGLQKDASKDIQFTFTAPSDSVNQIRFFVVTDVLDSIFELDESNNITASSWLKLQANTIQPADYNTLKGFYNSALGDNWVNKWITNSSVINSTNWYGVSFENGYVTSISLPANNVLSDFPLVLFSLPRLRTLNLNHNQISDKIIQNTVNLLLLNNLKTDSLITINLSENLLSGTLPALYAQFPKLRELNLEGNNICNMLAALPSHITNLNLNNQHITVDSIELSINPILNLPNITRYNHGNQSFEAKSCFYLRNDDVVVGHVQYDQQNNAVLNWYNSFGWNFTSGKTLTLQQYCGAASGTTADLKIYYQAGDANVDKELNILDIQHTLNFILDGNATPFNFSAADTYCDSLITVQDIVKTVNILLNQKIPVDPAEYVRRKAKSIDSAPAMLYIADNKLILETTISVAALDISLIGLTETQLNQQLSSYGFNVITRKLIDGSLRFVAFSMNGCEIPIGKNCIAVFNSKNTQLKKATLSSKQAEVIDVDINEKMITGTFNSSVSPLSLISNQAKVLLSLPSGFETVDISVYNPQGVELTQHRLQSPARGNYQFDFTNDIRTQGIYFIKVIAKSNNSTSSLNSKIIVSK